MFKTNLDKTLSKVNSFIDELKTGIENTNKSIADDRATIDEIRAGIMNKQTSIGQAEKLLNTLNG